MSDNNTKDAEVQHVMDLQDLSERVEAEWRELHPRKLYTRPPQPQPTQRRVLDFDSPTTASYAPSASNQNNLPLELTVNDLAALLDTTRSALRHRIERGETRNGRLPKELRRRRNQPYLWKRDTVIAFYSGEA